MGYDSAWWFSLLCGVAAGLGWLVARCCCEFGLLGDAGCLMVRLVLAILRLWCCGLRAGVL